MGYLDNSSITVDAILTKKGREILAQGRSAFNITQFALADDEVDYDLYNDQDSRGTAYWGATIEALPLTEALPDETQVMKYKLITLPAGQAFIPQIVETTVLNFNYNDTPKGLTPSISGYPNANSTLGYTIVVGDSSLVTIQTKTKAANQSASGSATTFLGDSVSTLYSAQSQAYVGLTFDIIPNYGNVAKSQTKTTTITIIGNETGGTLVKTVSVQGTTLQGI